MKRRVVELSALAFSIHAPSISCQADTSLPVNYVASAYAYLAKVDLKYFSGSLRGTAFPLKRPSNLRAANSVLIARVSLPTFRVAASPDSEHGRMFRQPFIHREPLVRCKLSIALVVEGRNGTNSSVGKANPAAFVAVVRHGTHRGALGASFLNNY